MNETETVARFLAETEYDDIPPEAVTHAKRMMIDTAGVSIAAADSLPVRLANSHANGLTPEMVEVLTKRDSDSAIGARRLGMDEGYTTLGHAAFVNGVMAHAIDFDDMHRRMKGHPSATVLPAVLALGEYGDTSGRELIEAFVLGVEIEALLGDILHPGLYERGWHPTAVFGHIGAAAAAGVLLDLTEAEHCRAIGIAASQAGGIKANFGTMTKPYHAGRAARCGVETARLAAAGYTANETVLEEEFGGFCDLFEGTPPHDFDDHVEELGEFWRFLNPPAVFKPYPCCGSPHAAMDCIVQLRDENAIHSKDIESITVRQHPRRFPHTDRPNPTTGDEGKFSVQYVIARMLNDGEVWLDDFTKEKVTEPQIRESMDLVTLEGDEATFATDVFGATVQVVTTDGTEYERTLKQPRAVNDDRLRSKYRRCCEGRLSPDAIDDSLALLEELESVESVDALVDTLVR